MHGPCPCSTRGCGRRVLAPTVVRLDPQGKALTQLATVQKKEVSIDVLPWAKWVELETPCRDEEARQASSGNCDPAVSPPPHGGSVNLPLL